MHYEGIKSFNRVLSGGDNRFVIFLTSGLWMVYLLNSLLN